MECNIYKNAARITPVGYRSAISNVKESCTIAIPTTTCAMILSLDLRLLTLVTFACTVASQSSNPFAVVQSDINKAISAVQAWNGQLTTVTPIQSDMDQINSDIKALKPNTPDPDTYLQGCQNVFEPPFSSLVDQLISRKTDFQSVAMGGTIKNDLVNIKGSIDSMGSTWISKTSSDRRSQVQACLAKLDNDANRGISAFS